MTAATTETKATLIVDDLHFELRRSARRKTLELTLERDGALIVKAPPGVDEATLAAFVREKKYWLYTKIAEKQALQQEVGSREFVSGEGFAYLGRSYRLLLVDAQDVPLKLEAGRFKLRRGDVGAGREHFVAWYTGHATTWLRRRVLSWATRMDVKPTSIEVRNLGFRWGSCGHGGRVHFHWATILLPPGLVDYVIVHELAHLLEPNHTPEFWQRVQRAMPDYERRKAALAAEGARIARF